VRNPFTPFLALLGLWVGLAEPSARAAAGQAGSQIVNQAGAAFIDPVAGDQTVLSNQVGEGRARLMDDLASRLPSRRSSAGFG